MATGVLISGSDHVMVADILELSASSTHSVFTLPPARVPADQGSSPGVGSDMGPKSSFWKSAEILQVLPLARIKGMCHHI